MRYLLAAFFFTFAPTPASAVTCTVVDDYGTQICTDGRIIYGPEYPLPLDCPAEPSGRS